MVLDKNWSKVHIKPKVSEWINLVQTSKYMELTTGTDDIYIYI